MTDKYEFEKSCFPQGVDNETPYVSKNWGYVQDINNGTYSANGQCLVQWDLSNLKNSAYLIDPSQMFMAVPITYVTAFVGASAVSSATPTLIAPPAGAWASTGLKNGYFQLLNGCDLSIGGKQVEQFVPSLNTYVTFKTLSQMSQDDLKTIGGSLGMGEILDNWESINFNPSYYQSTAGSAISTGTFPSALPVATSAYGMTANGISNNQPFAVNTGLPLICSATVSTVSTVTLTLTAAASTTVYAGMLVTGAGIPTNTFVASVSSTTVYVLSQSIANTPTGSPVYFWSPTPLGADFGDQAEQGTQFQGSYNNGIYTRMKKIPDLSIPAGTAAVSGNPNLYGPANALNTINSIKNESRPNYTVNGNYCIWQDVAIIRMCDILDSMKQFPLVKSFDGIFRAYLNVGSVVSNIVGGASNALQCTSSLGNTFTNSCPLMQTALKVYPQLATAQVSALFIGNPTNTSISAGISAAYGTAASMTVNFANAAASHFMPACRMYYPQIALKPMKLDHYITNNRAKKICFTSVLNNTFNNIGANTTNSFLVQSGVSSARGIFIMPFLSNSINGASNITATGALNTSIVPFSQFLSPFDTAPATNGPISLTNLQVTVGGTNVLSNVCSFSFEQFIEQVTCYEKINSSDYGLSCGLINQAYYENGYRVYYVDLSRSNTADLLTSKNISISFTNNCNYPVDIQVFTEYFREITIDVETCQVQV